MSALVRRTFIGLAGSGAAGLLVTGARPPLSAAERPRRFPRQELELVRELVRVSHFDVEAVRELVSDRPALAKASWDWGFGDWETGLGAASHTGRREIAEYLMVQGGRADVFTFAMLGHVDVVRGMVLARPGIQRTTGPHGLTLLHHARMGGREAEAVVAYLEELGDADPRPTDLALTAEERSAYAGTYRTESDEAATFQIVERREHLAFQHGTEAARDLLNQGEGVFHPVGAPAVRFGFDPGAAETRLTIRDGAERIRALRVTPS